MSSGDYDLRVSLVGTETLGGEIQVVDLVAICGALQELSTRVGREVVDRAGPGRTTEVLAQITRLRLLGLTGADIRGGTVLDFGYGDHAALPFEDDISDEIADLFWEVCDGIANSQRPGWANDLISASALALNRALDRTAARVTIARADGLTASWRPKDLNRTAWAPSDNKPLPGWR